MFVKSVFLTLVTLSCSISNAQQYDTPEIRRLKAEAERLAEEENKKASSKHPEIPSLQQKEAEAKEYLGKTFFYLPNPAASKRIRFFEKIPTSSYSSDPDLLFTPVTTTSFVVTGVVMAPPLLYPAGADEYLLEIKFPDGKVGYVNVVGCCGLRENLYKDQQDTDKEYVSLARDGTPSEKAALEEKLSRQKEKAALEDKLAREKTDRERAKLQQAKNLEKKRAEQAHREKMARPSPKIGMTKQQVINETNWGAPYDRNRTITAGRTREQWVYGLGRYLYFDNGILTGIQD